MEHPARMVGQPFQNFGMFVGRVVIDHRMNDLSGRDCALDRVEEFDEFGVGVPGHASADDGAVQDVEGGKQGGRAVAFVVVGQSRAFSRLQRKSGWVRSSAWIWLFSSIETTTAWAGGFM